ncbi:MAG: PilZ domain-containing protein [Bdellovibrionales bacterium]|nr:PilZ domain-containing protein [Bdellovibrionales bacterium]MBT3526680.1 PilZ domain-containing protein [Bdellovibrionales bacterium]MBT7765605.1 PilZ domain-containing protein [Bdellovibrionales bacterium]
MVSTKVRDKVVRDDWEIIKFFSALQNTKERIWLWQKKDADEIDSTRSGRENISVHFAQVKKIDTVKQVFCLLPARGGTFRFNRREPIFFYSPKSGMGSRMDVIEASDEYLYLKPPKQLTVIPKQLFNRLEVVEQECEEDYLERRRAARTKPKKTRNAGLHFTRESSNPLSYFEIYDMSSGGMGLVINDPGIFQPGDLITVVKVDDQDLPELIFGEIVSIRKFPDCDDLFKAGVKFI